MMLAMLITIIGMAQTQDDVTLTVTGDGATKEEATNNALCSAVAQAYGVFVSANTQILNDEVVKDEIATVTSGNIKEYKEVASLDMPNGRKEVTIQATVSISKLISYAQSKGASAEFAGATFTRNIKIYELNKENEKKAFSILLDQVKALIPFCYDAKLVIMSPSIPPESNEGKILNGVWSYFSGHYTNDNIGSSYKGIDQYMFSETLKNPRTAKDIALKRNVMQLTNSVNKWNEGTGAYKMQIKVIYDENENFKTLKSLVYNTFHSLALSQREQNFCDDSNIDYTHVWWSDHFFGFEDSDYFGKTFNNALIAMLDYGQEANNYRNSEEDIRKWTLKFLDIFYNYFLSFSIEDNMGIVSSVYECQALSPLYQRYGPDGSDANREAVNEKNCNNFKHAVIYMNEDDYILEGVGLFNPYARVRFDYDREPSPTVCLTFFIPQSDISKYTNFTVRK